METLGHAHATRICVCMVQTHVCVLHARVRINWHAYARYGSRNYLKQVSTLKLRFGTNLTLFGSHSKPQFS